jgi:phosphate starvation-inducible protein PhoH and related proteins
MPSISRLRPETPISHRLIRHSRYDVLYNYVNAHIASLVQELSAKLKRIEFSLTPADNRRLAELCGQHDQHLRQIEEYLGVEIANRGNDFRVVGPLDQSRSAERVIKSLYDATVDQEPLTLAGVHMALQESNTPRLQVADNGASETELRTPKRLVRPRGPRQTDYVRAILTHDINFGIGPAGTGKTYLAVAAAVEALESSRVQRIVLVRPVVEAGERLGFLPGALEEKIDPYLRPLYDALHEMVGFEKVQRLLERNSIEIAPLAYMRGRTLNDSFIILDEAQNTTAEQMKMFLTRIGFGTTAVITGDVTQIDLARSQVSGLKQASEILRDVPGISFTHFTPQDVVRHALVQKIVEAYEAYQRSDDPDRNSRR